MIALKVFQVLVGGAPRIVGKLLRDDAGRFILYRCCPYSVCYHRNLDAISFDARILSHLPEKMAQVIQEVEDKADPGKLLVAEWEVFQRDSVAANHGEGVQIYLPMNQWKKIRRSWKVPYTKTIEVIHAPEEPRPAQPQKPRTKPPDDQQGKLF